MFGQELSGLLPAGIRARERLESPAQTLQRLRNDEATKHRGTAELEQLADVHRRLAQLPEWPELADFCLSLSAICVALNDSL